MNKLLLKNVEVLLSDGTVVRSNIGIENTLIQFIGDVPEGWIADSTINGEDKLATAGFINAHTHAAMTLFRSYADDMLLMDWLENKIWPAEANLTAQDVYWGTMLAIAEMIKSGTTTFADMYFFMPDTAQAVLDSGIRACLARGMAGVAPTGEQALTESEEFYRNYHKSGDGRITVMLGPHAPYTCPPAYLERVINLADKLGSEIHIHLSETQGEVDECIKKYGKSPIRLMNDLGLFEHGVLAAHCVHLSKEDMEIMKEKNVRVAHNPGSNLKLASGFAPVTELLTNGITVGLGTDGAASNNNLDMLEEMRLAALIHKAAKLNPLAVPALEAYKMATQYGANAVGLGDVVGKLEVGRKADIVLFDTHKLHWYPHHDKLSLLVYSANSADVDTVLIDGKIVMKDGTLVTIDEEKLIAEVQSCGMRLVK